MNNYTNWSASGSKTNKLKFLSLLCKNDIRAFDGRRTAKQILKFGTSIKGIDYNRRNIRGGFFISTNKIDVGVKMHFDLDNTDLDIAVKFIMNI